MKKLAVLAVLALVAGVVFAQELANTTFGKLSGNEIQATKVAVPASGLTIGGTAVTATAAQLNAVNAGASITGNIPAASLTNAAGSLGSSIGGNIPVAALTNALAGTAYTTNTLTGDGVTNVFIWRTVGTAKILHSITTSP